MHEDWPKKVVKINKLIEQSNNSIVKKLSKLFNKAQFAVHYALIIRTLCFYQLKGRKEHEKRLSCNINGINSEGITDLMKKHDKLNDKCMPEGEY